jgi:hypothetical protein
MWYTIRYKIQRYVIHDTIQNTTIRDTQYDTKYNDTFYDSTTMILCINEEYEKFSYLLNQACMSEM